MLYEIKDMQVEWSVRYANTPTIQVLFDRLPEDVLSWPHEIIEQEGGRFYLAKAHGLVHFLYESDHDRQGYGGAIFNITLMDGSVRKVVGPWSSNAAAVNRFLPEEEQCIEITYTGETSKKHPWLDRPDPRTYPHSWGRMLFHGLGIQVLAANLWLSLHKKPFRIKKRVTQEIDPPLGTISPDLSSEQLTAVLGKRAAHKWEPWHEIVGFKPAKYGSSYDTKATSRIWREALVAVGEITEDTYRN